MQVNDPLLFAAVQKQCKNVEFVILDAPHILQSAHDPSDDATEAVQSSATPDAGSGPPELALRAWWTANEERTIYKGHKESIEFLRGILDEQQTPFDGVLGLSQGAAMAGLLTALLENPAQYTGVKPNHPPFRFGIFISGFRPLDVDVTGLFESGPLQTPTVHILGRQDVIVGSKRSQTLIDACQSPRVIWHESGHHIPSKASWRTFFKTYLAAWEPTSLIRPDDIPSPSGASASEPPSETNSGVTTPKEGRL